MMRKGYVNFIIIEVVVLVLGQGPIGDIMEMNFLFKNPSSLFLFIR